MPDLADVTELPLPQLLGSGDSTLTQSIRRLIASMDDHDGVLSAFQSFIQDDE